MYLVVITAINCFSVKLSNAVQIICTVAKLAIIAAIIIGGFVMLGQGNTEQFQNSFAGSTNSFSAIALGFYSGLWSYDGWLVTALRLYRGVTSTAGESVV